MSQAEERKGDYTALINFDHAYIAAQLIRCAEFLKVLRPLISSLKFVV
jgi:hypothetical protein